MPPPLEEKDPSAAISDPVKPIIYYYWTMVRLNLIRSALLEGASWWNQALRQPVTAMLSR